MKRRTFVAAAGAVSVSGLAGCGPAGRKTEAAGEKGTTSFELDELGVGDIGDGLRSGRWTSRRLLELYSGRIHDLDRNGPTLGAVIELNPEAEALADTL